MRKRKQGRKLSRKRDQRQALLRAEISALLAKEKIKTTEAKAKEVSKISEKFITRARQSFAEQNLGGQAKKGKLSTERYFLRFFSPEIAKKLLKEIGPRYKERKGGYTRIIKLGPRKSDGAKMAIIELVK